MHFFFLKAALSKTILAKTYKKECVSIRKRISVGRKKQMTENVNVVENILLHTVLRRQWIILKRIGEVGASVIFKFFVCSFTWCICVLRYTCCLKFSSIFQFGGFTWALFLLAPHICLQHEAINPK